MDQPIHSDETLFVSILSQAFAIPASQILATDLRVGNLSLTDFEQSKPSTVSVLLSRPDLIIEIEVRDLNSPSRILGVTVTPLKDSSAPAEMTFDVITQSTSVLSPAPRIMTDPVIAVINRYNIETISRCSLSLQLQHVEAGRYTCTLHCFDSFRDDQRTTLGRVGAIIDSDRWDLASLFIASPWEANTVDGYWRIFAPIFISDDLAPESLAKICSTCGITDLFVAGDLSIAEFFREIPINLVTYDGSESAFRAQLEDYCGKFTHHVVVPRQPEYALIAAWYARRVGKSLYLYDSLTEVTRLGLGEMDDLIIASNEVDQLPHVSTIVADSPAALNATLLQLLKSDGQNGQFEWLMNAAESMLEGVRTSLEQLLEEHSIQNEFRKSTNFNTSAVIANCSLATFAKLILGSSYAAGRGIDLYYCGAVDADGSASITHALDQVRTLVALEHSNDEDLRITNSELPDAFYEGPSSKAFELIFQSLIHLNETIFGVVAPEIGSILTATLPHYLILIGDTKIPLENICLGRGSHGLMTIGNVCAVGHLEFQSHFLTTQCLINAVKYLVPHSVKGTDLLLANPTLDLESTEQEKEIIERVLQDHGETDIQGFVREQVRAEIILGTFPTCKLVYYSGHGTVIADEVPALILHGEHGHELLFLDKQILPTELPTLVVFNGCVTTSESLAANVGFATRFLSLGALAFVGASEIIGTGSGSLIGIGLIRNLFYLPFGDSLLFAKHALATITIGQIEDGDSTSSNEDRAPALDLSWLSFQLYGDPCVGFHNCQLLATALYLENLSDVQYANGITPLSSAVRAAAAVCYYLVAQLYERQPEGDRSDMLQQAYLVLGESLTTLALKSNKQTALLTLACKAQEKSLSYTRPDMAAVSRSRVQLLQTEAARVSSLADSANSAMDAYLLHREAFSLMNRARKLARMHGHGRTFEGLALQYAADAYGHKGKHYAQLEEFDVAFRLFARSARYMEETIKRTKFIAPTMAGRIKQAHATMAWVAWRDAGVRLMPLGDYTAALSRLTESAGYFSRLGDEENATLVEAEATCVALLESLERLATSPEGVSVDDLCYQLHWLSLGWLSNFLAYVTLLNASSDEDNYPKVIARQYIGPLMLAARAARARVLRSLRVEIHPSLVEAALIFDCSILAWSKTLIRQSVIDHEVWTIYKRSCKDSTQTQHKSLTRQAFLFIYYSLTSNSKRNAIIRLAKATDVANEADSFGLRALMELCGHSILGTAFREVESFPFREAARIYAFAARQSSDRTAKGNYYELASDCWHKAGDVARAYLYKAMSAITGPPRNDVNLARTLDYLMAASENLTLGTFEARLCESNIWIIRVQLLIEQSNDALAQEDRHQAEVLAEQAVQEVEKGRVRFESREIAEHAKCWKDVVQAIILIVSTDERESQLSQSEIRRAYHKAYRLLKPHEQSSYAEIVTFFKRKAEGEFYYHAGYKVFEEIITPRNAYRSLRYARFFLKSGSRFQGTELEHNSYNHGFQLIGAYHYSRADELMATQNYSLSKYHIAQALRHFSEAYSRRLRPDSPQTLLYRYRIFELRSLENIVNFQQNRNLQYLWLAASFAKRAYSLLEQQPTNAVSIGELAAARKRFDMLVEACRSIGISFPL